MKVCFCYHFVLPAWAVEPAGFFVFVQVVFFPSAVVEIFVVFVQVVAFPSAVVEFFVVFVQVVAFPFAEEFVGCYYPFVQIDGVVVVVADEAALPVSSPFVVAGAVVFHYQPFCYQVGGRANCLDYYSFPLAAQTFYHCCQAYFPDYFFQAVGLSCY
jgi:hypothetical protein